MNKPLNQNDSKKAQHNSVPNCIFMPFKRKKIITVILNLISLILCIILLFSDGGKYFSNADSLRETASFALNILLVVAALGLSVFFSPLKSTQDKEAQRKLLFRYIGETLCLASMAILGYILSYCSFLSMYIFGLYNIAMLVLLCFGITHTLATIIAYFDIRD